MSLVDEIRKLEAPDLLVYVGSFLATVTPGFLTIYMFRPDLLVGLDVVKLLIFCLAITLPAYAANYIVGVHVEAPGEQKLTKRQHYGAVATGAWLTIATFHPALLIAYFWALPFKGFFGVLVVFHIFFWAAGIAKIRQRRTVKNADIGPGRAPG